MTPPEEAMADLLMAVVDGKIKLTEVGDGSYLRNDGEEVFTDDVFNLKNRGLLESDLAPTLEGKEVARRGRDWMIELFSRS